MKISIVIIGYNSSDTLEYLLKSINRLNYNHRCEIIYVDDGSRDNSLNLFKNTKLKFDKKSFGFNQNRGRVYARQKAITMCLGEWICFVQSNVVLDCNLLIEYEKFLHRDNVLALGGRVCYQSKDSSFSQYLNNNNRGINKYKNGSCLDFRNLLFLNCLVKRSVFDVINFNVKFSKYGGKELDFSYRLISKFPNSIVACKNAVVTRIQYPSYAHHCLRMIEFGKHNFKYLNHSLKCDVIKFPFLLNKFFGFYFLIMFFYFLCLRLYKLKLFKLNYLVIRCGLLMALLRGYYQSK